MAKKKAKDADPWIAVYYREGDERDEISEEDIAAGVGPDPAPARAFLMAAPTHSCYGAYVRQGGHHEERTAEAGGRGF